MSIILNILQYLSFFLTKNEENSCIDFKKIIIIVLYFEMEEVLCINQL